MRAPGACRVTHSPHLSICVLAQGPTEGNSFWRAGLQKRVRGNGANPTTVRRVEGLAGEKGSEAPSDGKAVLHVEPAALV